MKRQKSLTRSATAVERLFEIEELATHLSAKSQDGMMFQLGLIAAAVDMIVGLVPEEQSYEEAKRQEEAIRRMLLSIAHHLPYSIDRLLFMLTRLGQDVRIEVSRPMKPKKEGSITVTG